MHVVFRRTKSLSLLSNTTFSPTVSFLSSFLSHMLDQLSLCLAVAPARYSARSDLMKKQKPEFEKGKANHTFGIGRDKRSEDK